MNTKESNADNYWVRDSIALHSNHDLIKGLDNIVDGVVNEVVQRIADHGSITAAPLYKKEVTVWFSVPDEYEECLSPETKESPRLQCSLRSLFCTAINLSGWWDDEQLEITIRDIDWISEKLHAIKEKREKVENQ